MGKMKKQLDILVVEDTPKHQDAAKALLEGHNLTIADTFEKAAKYLTRYSCNSAIEPGPQHFDAVLTDLFFKTGNTECRDGYTIEAAFGWPVALIAAQQGVKHIAMVTDVNHHQDPVVSAFDFFKAKKNWKWTSPYAGGRREPYHIEGSLFVAYDVRDLPPVFVLKDGTFTEKEPLCRHECDEQKDREIDLQAGYVLKSAKESGAEWIYRTAKNWKVALELLLLEGSKQKVQIKRH